MTTSSIRNRAGMWLAAAFLLFAAGIGALWHSATSAYEAAVLRERGRELQAIAELKIEFVRFWLDERRSDAVVQAGRLMMANVLRPRPGAAGAYPPEAVAGHMEAVRKIYDYKAVALLDLGGNHRIGAGRLSAFGRNSTAAAAKAAVAAGKPHVARAYHQEEAGRRHVDIDFAAPILDSRQPGAPVVGALVFHLDSRIHLDPLMRGWPSASESGEAFLFERAGDEIVYLSSLRRTDNQALRKRISETTLPAALAARGWQGITEGLDYRGVPVLAAVGQVPDMPWFVVAKLDRDEILAPVRREALWSGGLSALLALALGLAMLAWRQRSRMAQALAMARTEAALHESEERYRFLFELSPDAVFVHRDDILLFANDAAARLFHADAPRELAGRDWHALLVQESWFATEKRIALLTSGELAFLPPTEQRYLTLDGTVVEVEATAARIVIEGQPAILSVVRDIGERRQAEALRLQQCREQRDTLVREVHHRIKNHLQGLTGLLNRHRRRPLSPDTLDAVIAQIAAISVIHGLQGREIGGEVRPVMLLQEISAFLGAQAPLAFANADDPRCQACPWRIVDEECVPVALIANELVTNAIKHRDGAGRGEPVRIACACDSEKISVVVRHPGALPAGFDFAAGSGLGTGLGLVKSLLSREGATLSIAADGGAVETCLTLTAPVVSRTPDDQVASRR